MNPTLKEGDPGERREFLKKSLVTAVYVAPLITAFASKDLVRAQSRTGSSPGSPGSPDSPGSGTSESSTARTRRKP